jgi:beta-1,4-N-acetylglucosaminyltransferase
MGGLAAAAASLDDPRVRVLLVASPGGHLLQLLALQDAWEGYSNAWVTLDRADARGLLDGRRVFFARGPTNRSIRNLLRNLVLARSVVRTVRPQVIITTGAGVAVPFAWLGWLAGARVVYIESLSRIDKASLSCRLISPIATRVYGQWPEFAGVVRRARFAGCVFSQ